MNCVEVENKLDDYQSKQMSLEDQREFEQHIDGCKNCAALVRDDSILTAALKSMPEVEVDDGFEQRMFAEVRQQYPAKTATAERDNRFAAGFITAMAASLAIWFAATVFVPVSIDSQSPVIEVALHEPSSVKLMFESQADIQQVAVNIALPEGVEIEGYPGQQQLSWSTQLKKGSNILELPVLMNQPGQSEIVAQLSYGEKVKTLHIKLKSKANGVMSVVQHNDASA